MKKTLTVLCAALVLSTPLASFAQPGPDHHDDGPPHQGNPHPGQPQRFDHHDNGRRPAYPNPNFRPEAGYVIEPRYRADRYWVTDWRARHLYAPPHDHRWLYVNGDYVLVAIATGVVVSVLSGY